MKFKVGDRVVEIDEGDIGTVVEMDTEFETIFTLPMDAIRIHFDSVSYSVGFSYHWRQEKDVRLLTPLEKAMK